MRGRVVLGVSGGIAAYKSVELLRGLVTAGVRARVIMTRHSTEFVNPRTFAVLSASFVEVDQWESANDPGVDHVDLSHWADLLLVAPATANTIGKMAQGIADDSLSTYHLAHRRGVVVAPAMNTVMWRQPVVQANLALLRQRQVVVVPPSSGELACGDEGEGRLAPVEVILDQALKLLPKRGPLAGVRILVSTGPTREAVDLVRVLSNRSSGRMGVAVAVAARDLGAKVVLLHGPMSQAVPAGVECVAVETAVEMEAALGRLATTVDAAFLAAAVADFRPIETARGKLDRRDGGSKIDLQPVPDLAAGVGAMARRPYLVVFSAENGPQKERALTKMRAKKADAVVLNDVASKGVGMEAADNEVWVMTASGVQRHVPRADKKVVGREIILGVAGEVLASRAATVDR